MLNPLRIRQTKTEKLEAREVCSLASWTRLLAFYENLDLDPLDSVKIAAIRHCGLLKSAKLEKVQVEEALQNVHNHYTFKANLLASIVSIVIY